MIEEWKKENEERKKYLESTDADYWYEHLVVEKELFSEPREAFKLPGY